MMGLLAAAVGFVLFFGDAFLVKRMARSLVYGSVGSGGGLVLALSAARLLIMGAALFVALGTFSLPAVWLVLGALGGFVGFFLTVRG